MLSKEEHKPPSSVYISIGRTQTFCDSRHT
jgi:hypothetical protein